ncbi:uncharacterized protein ColSpa_11515 [Colletotrichum spaethianum]|uniref:Uncharacterized protein n=1 Tax=Colletotrichum spaethianum TaxID=700344 RepID=A0AA37PFM5_9PEZI|nr:uncharacterized protein ColSpa_11515 [Colletotrichum spaethianum]GKT51334.1 hypothetical protein ColSpa_11515 [Colletotrichum spaethianum]
MHIPTFGQVATIGMAFFAVAALAVPIAEPLEADLVEAKIHQLIDILQRSADLATRGEGISGFTSSVNALEQRNSKKKCKRTNQKGNCSDSDSDNDKKNKKKCKRNSKGNCSDSDDDKKKKNKQCKRNSKGNCSDSDDDKKNGGKKNDDKKNDDKGNKGVYYRREVAAEFDLE